MPDAVVSSTRRAGTRSVRLVLTGAERGRRKRVQKSHENEDRETAPGQGERQDVAKHNMRLERPNLLLCVRHGRDGTCLAAQPRPLSIRPARRSPQTDGKAVGRRCNCMGKRER